MKKQKQKITQTVDSIEAIKDLPGSIKRAAADEGKKVVADIWKQFLNPNPKSAENSNPENQEVSLHRKQGELTPGEEVDLRQEEQLAHVEPGIDYVREIVHAERKIQVKEEHETKVKIQEIIVEIRKLTSSSKELAIQFKDVEKMEQVPANAGKYHANFVEWMLSMIRGAREKVDNALSWTTALKSKKSQRQYWSLFKKHGTSFVLSAERYAVTQVG